MENMTGSVDEMIKQVTGVDNLANVYLIFDEDGACVYSCLIY